MRIAFSSLVLVLTIACSNRHGDPIELIGSTIAPPSPFDTLKVGMTVAEAKAALPELTGELAKAGFGELLVDKVPVRVFFEHSRIVRIALRLERPSFEAELVKRWGAAQPVAPGVAEWNGPTWRASHACKDGACTATFQRPLRPLTAAFFGPKPAPPGALANLRRAMPAEEAKRLAPELVGPDATTSPDLGVDDVESEALVALEPGGAGVQRIRIGLATNAAFELLKSAWGPGEMMKDWAGMRSLCWQGNPWRACMFDEHENHRTIEFERVLPLSTVLGPGAEVAYAEGTLGAKRADIVAKYGAAQDPRVCTECPRFSIPDSDYGRMFLDFEIQNDAVKSYYLTVAYGSEEDRATAFTAIAAKWDPKAKLAAMEPQTPVTLRAKAPVVTVTDVLEANEHGGNVWRVHVTP